jgi:beta-glucanase (GH16 family)
MKNKRISITTALVALGLSVSGQVGQLLWQEEFNNLNNWIVETGNGSWGWGNGELEYYHANNVYVGPIPGESGNNAVHIVAKQESGPTIVDQWGNPLNYTSGRINSKSTVSVQFGMVEARVKIPNIDLGGWPAFWMLGTSNYGWPSTGELDIMEMGHQQAFRDLHDSHNGGNGLGNSTVNNVVGANAIYYDANTINSGNPLGAASIAWDPQDVNCRPYYNYSPGLVDRFLVYRMYWDPDTVRFTVEDNGVEHDLYQTALAIDSNSREFHRPFYFVMNMAIGGAFTDAYNLGDPASGLPVSMSFPSEMLVDYVRVYEWKGHGSVQLGPNPQELGTYALFTDNTPFDNTMLIDSTGHIYVWEETLVPGSGTPFEGPNGISWTTNGKGWFGAGIMSAQPLNLSAYELGDIHFSIKIPASVTFKIGLLDAWGNQSWVEFPANQPKYGISRNGQWEQAVVPVADIRGTLIDLRMMKYSFVILEENGASCDVQLDDIYWSGGALSSNYQFEGFNNLMAYPNPSNGPITVHWFQKIGGAVHWELRNTAGKVVNSWTNEIIPAGENSLSLETENLSPGLYILTMTSNNERETLRLIVNN